MANFFDRTELLLKKENIDKLTNSSVLVVGVGGVGGYVAEFLIRAGVGKITLVDHDVVETTNINRQLVAMHSTVGQAKVLLLTSRIRDINPSAEIFSKFIRFNEENKDLVFDKHYDYVVDAIDSVEDKVHLICESRQREIKIISSMGAGNRIDTPHYEISDIYSTTNDGLAKVMRKKLREKSIDKLTCVYTKSRAINSGSLVGSISYHPATCAAVLSSEVIKGLINND